MSSVLGTGWLELTDLRDVIDFGGGFRLRVDGWSMYPALLKGDEITVEAASPAALRRGDLVVFRQRLRHGEALVCHRLVDVEHTNGDRSFRLKGDATTGSGERVRSDQVLGRVVHIRRSGWRGWPLAAPCARLVDRVRTRLRERLAGGLECLQRSGLYRRLAHRMLARRIVISVGVPDGAHRFRYRPIVAGTPASVGRLREFRLTARRGRIEVATLQAAPSADGYDVRALYVRRWYRRLGLGRRLLELAVVLAFDAGAVAVRVTIERDDGAGRRLLHASGFRETAGGHAIYKEGPHVPDLRAEVRRT